MVLFCDLKPEGIGKEAVLGVINAGVPPKFFLTSIFWDKQ